MDECLVVCAVDLCGRPYLSFDDVFTVPKCGDMDTEMVREFSMLFPMRGSNESAYKKVLTPGNNHHMMEAMFKAFAKALDMAVEMDSRITDVLSTKGSL